MSLFFWSGFGFFGGKGAVFGKGANCCRGSAGSGF